MKTKDGKCHLILSFSERDMAIRIGGQRPGVRVWGGYCVWGEGECILNISLSLMRVSALRLNGFSGVAGYMGLAGGRALMGGSYGH